MGMSWEKELSVENAVIDSDHKNLMNMINSIERAIRSKDCPAIIQAFKSIEDWLCVHFANEERIAQAISFDFSKQKPAREYLLRELLHLKNELISKKGIWCESAIEHYDRSLRDWLIEHIIKVDMPMKPMLQAIDYKFWPGWSEGESNHAAGHIASLYLNLHNAPAQHSA